MARFVSIETTHDPVRAEVIKDVLAQEGITATIAGAQHSALLGLAGAMIQIRVEVPESDAVRASEIVAALDDEEQVLVDDSAEARELASYEHASGRAPLAGEGPYRLAPKRAAPSRPRLKRVAAFLAIAVTFGTGHFYAGAAGRGLALLVAEVAILVAGVGTPLLMWGLPAVMALDLFGSVREIERGRAKPSRDGA